MWSWRFAGRRCCAWRKCPSGLGLTLFFDEKTRTIKGGDGRLIPSLTYDTVVPHFG